MSRNTTRPIEIIKKILERKKAIYITHFKSKSNIATILRYKVGDKTVYIYDMQNGKGECELFVSKDNGMSVEVDIEYLKKL